MAIMSSDFLPFLAMVIVQTGYAVMCILVKLVLDSGMSPLVLVAYRQVFATIPMVPLAYFLERKTRPKITWSILFLIFLCSIFGATMNQLFYFIGLKYTTPTIGCALTNILPAVTFVLAVVCKQETVGLNKKQGQAKVLGTTLCVGGAMLLSFYHGRTIGIGESSIHLHSVGKTSTTSNNNNSHNRNMFLGPFIFLASCVAMAGWFIIQVSHIMWGSFAPVWTLSGGAPLGAQHHEARLNEKFAAPYTSTALMCLMACIECVLITFCFEHNLSAWSLASGIKLVTSIYVGFVCSALAFCLMTWCIRRKGALYVSVFSPLLLIIAAILSWAFLNEKLYVGTYGAEKDEGNEDLELQSNGKNNPTDFKEDHCTKPS
ncbi:EamA domain [Dillenia turbinata]|uniref:WAT1-related protein n=1 Tax=Dillenia turbinata TaxID=194707 RepID=A0AAN8UA55_9MAGN